MNEEEKRIAITKFLQWNDNNGAYSDESCDIEQMCRMTYKESMVYFFKAMNDTIAEDIFDLDYFSYEEIVQCLKENNLYNSTIEKLNMLLSGEKYSNIIV